MLKPFKILHKGYDTVDVAYKMSISEHYLEMFAEKKKEAQALLHEESVHFEYLGEVFKVYGQGRSGGYAFRLEHEVGNFWFKNTEQFDWSVLVSVGSESLLKFGGLSEVRDRLENILFMFKKGLEIEHAISRVDYCIDVYMGDLSFNPFQFTVAGFKKTDNNPEVLEILNALEYEKDSIKSLMEKPDMLDSSYHMMARECTGIRFGKMPNRQLNIYNKTVEARVKRKNYWFKVWRKVWPNFDAGKHKVWRIESRAGKDTLKKYTETRTFEDIQKLAPSILRQALDLVQYKAERMEDTTDSNYARTKTHPYWEQIQEEFSKVEEPGHDYETLCMVRKSVTRQLISDIEKQNFGCMATASWMNGARDEADFEEYIHAMAMRYMEMAENDLAERYKKCENKYALKKDYFGDEYVQWI